MQKTNISDRISQRKYFLARLSKQCLQVHAKHSGQLAQLACQYHVLFAAVYLPYTEPSQNREVASQLSTYSVCSSKGKIARYLDKASMLARQIAHNTAVELHYSQARSQSSLQVLEVRSPQFGYLQLASQLASYLTQLGCFQVVQLGHSLYT